MPSQHEVAISGDDTPSLMTVILKASRDPNMDVAKLSALIALQERVAANQARSEYTRALAQVAAEVEPIRKDATNPTFGRKYATLSAIDAALRPVYSRHGFSVSYGTVPAPSGSIGVSCTIAHEAGHMETLSLIAPLDTTTGGRSRTPVQALGSSVTYLKRYLLTMALPVSFYEDDDGNGGDPDKRGNPDRHVGGPPLRRDPPPRQEQGPPAETPSSVTYPPGEPSREERRRSIGDWLDDYERAIAQVRPTDRYAAEALLDREDVKQVGKIVQGEAKTRFGKLQGRVWEIIMANPQAPQPPAEPALPLEPGAVEPEEATDA